MPALAARCELVFGDEGDDLMAGAAPAETCYGIKEQEHQKDESGAACSVAHGVKW